MRTIKQILSLTLALSLNHAQSMKQNFDEKYLMKSLFKTCNKDNRNLEEIKSLINNKADVNYRDRYGQTPLHYTCCKNNVSLEVMTYLIENKADIHSEDDDGPIPLHYACLFNNAPLPTIKALLASFIDRQAIFTYLCCIKKIAKQLEKIIPKPIQLMILNFTITYNIQNYIGMKNNDNKTALDYAREKNHVTIILFFDSLHKAFDQGIITFFNDFDEAAEKEDEALIELLKSYKNKN